jgi:hypothetical protein
MNELVEIIQKSSVEKPTADILQNSFAPLFDKAKAWADEAKEIVVTDSEQKDLMIKAREIRLSLKDIRVTADKKRKELKEDSLRYGKAVQGVYNVIEFLIAPIEKHLENQERFVERQEEKKRLLIKEAREEECRIYSEFIPAGLDFGFMTETDYQRLLTGFKVQQQLKEDAIKKEAEEKAAAEQKRLEEQQKIKEENERLKKEAEEKEKVLAEERAALKAEREAREKAEQEKKDAEAKILQEKEIEEKRIKAEKEAARKANNAPDREKIVKFISDLSLIQYPDVKSADANKIIDFARAEIGKISAQLSNKIAQL